jgi:hypothetical protein
METQKDMKTPSVSFLESQAKLVNLKEQVETSTRQW